MLHHLYDSGGYASIRHDRCFENWCSTDKLWYALSIHDFRAEHGRGVGKRLRAETESLGNAHAVALVPGVPTTVAASCPLSHVEMHAVQAK